MLILGETGVGKEGIARLVHEMDPRPNKQPLVILDCTTIVPELSGSEFFGHERGAFTGAVAARDGAFALANGGTLFLDEIGELPLTLQAALLRVIQEGTYKRVGSNIWHQACFRLVCATNKNLEEEASRGKFRHDLYHRIAAWICKVPPLRDRSADILPIVHHFLKEGKGVPISLDEPVRQYLLNRDYPGNVRDLKQLVSRFCHRHVGLGPITVGDIPALERPATEDRHISWCDERFRSHIRMALESGMTLKEISRTAENEAIRIAIDDENGNLQRAASKLGVTDRTLQLRRAARRQEIEEPTQV